MSASSQPGGGRGRPPDSKETIPTTISKTSENDMHAGVTLSHGSPATHHRTQSAATKRREHGQRDNAIKSSADLSRLTNNRNSAGEMVGLVDDAVNVDNSRQNAQDSKNEMASPPRLVVVSNKIKNSILMQSAVQHNVSFILYKYDSSTLDSLLGSIAQTLGTKKVESMALLLHNTSSTIYVTGKDDKFITKENIIEAPSVRSFFSTLIDNHLDRSWINARVDLLACNAAQSVDGGLIARELETIVEVPVGISKDMAGSDIQLERIGEDPTKYSCLGELYFRPERLRSWTGSNPPTSGLAGFERIRTVGKGAYGAAVLYRKKDDDSYVILKEINLHDLTAGERQMALNEVRVLSMLDHPYIVSYYDSFEEDGIVMIEMEYAEGGTLSQFLALQDKPLEEREILTMFSQIVSAIKYIHEHNVLHRDLKTANIFLTKDGQVKLGDFGISKMMSTANQAANTLLGTPYYISPEMCEGKSYNDRSDMWALGCILYEIACLQKTFGASNLPALVNKIMTGQYAPVKGDYSDELKQLIIDLLQRDPAKRPSAAELWDNCLPELMNRYNDEPVTDNEDDSLNSSGNQTKQKKIRSVLFYFDMAQQQPHPIELPPRMKIRDVAAGSDHVVVVSMERMIYTWGEGSKGQLAHGNTESMTKPRLSEPLKGKSIVRACCGDGFSVFLSDNGIIMTCGDGTFGCLGHGDWSSTSRPRLIEALLSVDVISVACGSKHIVAVGSEGEVYVWGCGGDGRLGLSSEEDQCQPVEVPLPQSIRAKQCFCGRDGSMLLTDVGSVLACGNNEYNKLGLNQRQGFLMAMKNIFNKTEVAGAKEFTTVRALASHKVVSISMGAHHSAVVTDPGHVLTFGRNSEGQLGTGNARLHAAPFEVPIFQEKSAQKVQCSEYYSVAFTCHNDMLFWGTRFKTAARLDDSWGRTTASINKNALKVQSAGHSRHNSTTSLCNMTEGIETTEDATVARGQKQESAETVSSQANTELSNSNKYSSGGFRPLSSTIRRTPSASSAKEHGGEVTRREDCEMITTPTALLRMDFSGSRSQAGDTVTMSKFFCHGENLIIQVETTAPPPKRRKRRISRRRLSSQGTDPSESSGNMPRSASSRDGGDEYSSEASELDSAGSIPPWLQQELEEATKEPPISNYPDEISENSGEDDDGESHGLDSSLTSIKINRNLKHSEPLQVNSRLSNTPTTTSSATSSKKMSSLDTGFESLAVDVLSSSSSSDTMPTLPRPRTADKAVKIVPVVPVPKKSSSAGPRRTVTGAGAPYKSKPVPKAVTEKPLGRIRANRRSDGNRDIGSARSTESDTKVKQDNIDKLETELQKMRDEKKMAEEKLKLIEQEQQQQKHEETQKKSSEREHLLQQQLELMRHQIHEQNDRLQDNYKVMLTMQEQLMKVQSEQVRMSTQESSRSSSRQSSQRESKICVLQ